MKEVLLSLKAVSTLFGICLVLFWGVQQEDNLRTLVQFGEYFRKSYFLIVKAVVKCSLLPPHEGETSYSTQCSYVPRSLDLPQKYFGVI